ncbi:hypothetical protein ACFL14_00435 [Patescibacteria group bacterium]
MSNIDVYELMVQAFPFLKKIAAGIVPDQYCITNDLPMHVLASSSCAFDADGDEVEVSSSIIDASGQILTFRWAQKELESASIQAMAHFIMKPTIQPNTLLPAKFSSIGIVKYALLYGVLSIQRMIRVETLTKIVLLRSIRSNQKSSNRDVN